MAQKVEKVKSSKWLKGYKWVSRVLKGPKSLKGSKMYKGSKGLSSKDYVPTAVTGLNG